MEISECKKDLKFGIKHYQKKGYSIDATRLMFMYYTLELLQDRDKESIDSINELNWQLKSLNKRLSILEELEGFALAVQDLKRLITK